MEDLKVFQACGAVNVETGDMFLRITEWLVSALVALRCADKRLFARARWDARFCFPFLVALSVVMTSRALAQVKKVVRIVLHAHATHFLSFSCEIRQMNACCSFRSGPFLVR